MSRFFSETGTPKSEDADRSKKKKNADAEKSKKKTSATDDKVKEEEVVVEVDTENVNEANDEVC